ncbi:hypothetical protein GCM10027093_71830 [Paraburkholderia jirisanensis]
MARTVKPRKRIFVGCEGESERSYVALLQQFMGIRAEFHLVNDVLNGGDPLAIVDSAIKALRRDATKNRGAFVAKFVLLDSDLLGRDAARDARCVQLAAQHELQLIWQEPCHEALILRHLDNCHDKRPPTTQASAQQLGKEWPEYSKNCGREKLSQRITPASLESAARCEPQLAALLVRIGLVKPDPQG